MNIKRGLYRLWLVCSVLYVLVVALFSYQPIRQELAKEAAEERLFADVRIPVMCHKARGNAGTDYYPTKGFDNPINPFSSCWYKIDRYRAIFPEDAEKSDAQLVAEGYRNNGETLPERTADARQVVVTAAAIAVGPPLFLLLVGMAFVWAFSGFKRGTA